MAKRSKVLNTPTPPVDVFADPPRKHVMLLSCMDQRLLDDTVRFMNELNLHNRYDQVIFAGAAMGASKLSTPLPLKPPASVGCPLAWKNVFFDQLAVAIDGLRRPIHDIFLLEHMDCGAYKKLYPDEDVQKAYAKCRTATEWTPFHKREVLPFAKEVVKFCKDRSSEDPWNDMQVWSLLMDMRGNVVTLGCDAIYTPEE